MLKEVIKYHISSSFSDLYKQLIYTKRDVLKEVQGNIIFLLSTAVIWGREWVYEE